jgi:hypothetical protein
LENRSAFNVGSGMVGPDLNVSHLQDLRKLDNEFLGDDKEPVEQSNVKEGDILLCHLWKPEVEAPADSTDPKKKDGLKTRDYSGSATEVMVAETAEDATPDVEPAYTAFSGGGATLGSGAQAAAVMLRSSAAPLPPSRL